jgi:hypothetical protein
MKNALLLVLSGAMMGIAVASFVVPPLISWYTSPGGLPKGAEIQAVVQIPEVVKYVSSRLLIGQSIGAAIGAALGAAVYFMTRKSTPPLSTPVAPASAPLTNNKL